MKPLLLLGASAIIAWIPKKGSRNHPFQAKLHKMIKIGEPEYIHQALIFEESLNEGQIIDPTLLKRSLLKDCGYWFYESEEGWKIIQKNKTPVSVVFNFYNTYIEELEYIRDYQITNPQLSPKEAEAKIYPQSLKFEKKVYDFLTANLLPEEMKTIIHHPTPDSATLEVTIKTTRNLPSVWPQNSPFPDDENIEFTVFVLC